MKFLSLFIFVHSLFVDSLFVHSLSVDSLFCRNCKFFIQQKGSPESFGKCGLFPRIEEDYFLVTGVMETNTDFYYCSTVRKFENMCGEKGKLYQDKMTSI